MAFKHCYIHKYEHKLQPTFTNMLLLTNSETHEWPFHSEASCGISKERFKETGLGWFQ